MPIMIGIEKISNTKRPELKKTHSNDFENHTDHNAIVWRFSMRSNPVRPRSSLCRAHPENPFMVTTFDTPNLSTYSKVTDAPSDRNIPRRHRENKVAFRPKTIWNRKWVDASKFATYEPPYRISNVFSFGPSKP